MTEGSIFYCYMNELISTQDGSHSILSERFGVAYHSRYGAIQESLHVFIQAGLYFQAFQTKKLHILEMGFGTGLNAFLSMLEGRNKNLEVNYEAIDAYPLSTEEASLLNYPACLEVDNETGALFYEMHKKSWGEHHQLTPAFSLKKHLIKLEDYQPEQPDYFNLIYFDAFSPTAQPELWEPPIWEKLYHAIAPGGTLVTYCAKGAFKRNLRAVGFNIENPPGPPGKREMTRALKPL